MNYVAAFSTDYFSPDAAPQVCATCGKLTDAYDIDIDGNCPNCEVVTCIGCGETVNVKQAKYYLGRCICDDCATYSVEHEDRSPRLISLSHIEMENDLKRKCEKALQELKDEIPNTINSIKENCKPLNN